MKKVIGLFLIVAVVTTTGYNVYQSNHSVMNGLSGLALANVEALAESEDDIVQGGYDVMEQTTDYKYNGKLYRQSKVVECYEGGEHRCKSGKYHRYLKDDGTWSEWIPA